MTTPSNEVVGQLLGVSHATVSRYKSGDRLPELDTMAKITEVYGWTLDDQYQARKNGTYASEFTSRISDCSARGTLVKDATPNQQGHSGEAASYPSAE